MKYVTEQLITSQPLEMENWKPLRAFSFLLTNRSKKTGLFPKNMLFSTTTSFL